MHLRFDVFFLRFVNMTPGLDPALLGLVARILLVVLFPFSAIGKMLHWDLAVKQANSSFLPGGPFLLVCGMMIEVVAPVCIVTGWHAGIAALLLAAFCAATALLYKPFWTQGDFWSRSESRAREAFWDFLKNFGLAGGLLLVALGAGFAATPT